MKGWEGTRTINELNSETTQSRDLTSSLDCHGADYHHRDGLKDFQVVLLKNHPARIALSAESARPWKKQVHAVRPRGPKEG